MNNPSPLTTPGGWAVFEQEEARQMRRERWAIIAAIILLIGGWGLWAWKFGGIWEDGTWNCHATADGGSVCVRRLEPGPAVRR